MPEKTAEKLQALLEAGDTDGCVRFFADAGEDERRVLAKLADAWMKRVSKETIQETSPGHFQRNELLPAAGVAILATCSLSTIKKFGWRVFPGDVPFLGVLADRRPKWLDEYAEALLEGDHPSWLTVRSMMKAGLCRKPKHDNYVLGMVHHHDGIGGMSSDPTERQGYTSSTWCILSHLEAEPDLLEDLWRLFEFEGGGEYSLAAHDKYARGENRWDLTFVALAQRGTFSRERLLDASLESLDRGFAQFRAGWFSAFHELLQPTLEERVARTDHYLRLLASPIPPTVTFALAAVETIDNDRSLPPGSLIDGLRPLMLARAKGTVKAALKLLDRAARRDPQQASRIARVAAEALACEASDVQAAALKCIETHGARGDGELVEAVSRGRDLVAASLRKRLADWLQSEPAETGRKSTPGQNAVTEKSRTARAAATGPAEFKALEKRAERLPEEWRRLASVDRALAALWSGTLDLTAFEFDGTEFPRLRRDRAIVPLTTLDDLIDAALAAIENPDDGDGIERVYDGISRLCDQRPADFERRTGPLRKRTMEVMSRRWLIPFLGDSPLADLLGVVLSWLTGECGTFTRTKFQDEPAVEYRLGEITRTGDVPDETGIRRGLPLRAKALAERAAKCQAAPLLSAPTQAGGWIDPVVLAQRVRTMNGAAEADEIDQVLSLLRLAPEHRPEGLPLLADVKGEYVAALRYALGEPSVRVGETSSLWASSARARSPWTDDERVAKRHPGLGPDAGEAARGTFQTTKTDRWVRLIITVSPAFPKKPDGRLLSVALWKQPDADHFRAVATSVSAIRALQSIWPVAQESCFAMGAVELAGNLDWWEACWWNRTWMEPLLDPDVPLRPMALLVLVLGLAAREPGEHGLATDAAVAAINDGRLDGVKLGASMAELLPTGLVKAARWAKTLGDISRASPLHAEVVRVAISRALRGKIKAMPNDLHALVDLLKELVAESESPVDDEARDFLGQISGSTKLAKAAKAILACSALPDADRALAIQRTVVEHRLARVERWLESSL